MQWPWRKTETELDREIRYHLESLAAEFERQGMSSAEAMRRARREFGGVEKTKDACRDESRWQWLAQLRQDLAFGIRMLRKAPVVTAAAVLSLALGIGATTAILSLMDAVLWKQLPLPAPAQLVEIVWQAKADPEGVFDGSSGSMYPEGPLHVADFFSRRSFERMRDTAAGSAAEVAAHSYPVEVSTSYAGSTAVVRQRSVSGNFFRMLGAQPWAGRLLQRADDDPAAPAAAVATHAFFESALGGDRAAIGRALRINNRVHLLAGVLPPGFAGVRTGEDTGLYTALAHHPDLFTHESWLAANAGNPRAWWLQLMARRAPGVTTEALFARLDPVFRSTWEGQPKNPAGAPVLRLQDGSRGLGSVRRELGNPFYILLGLVALVLTIACANIANLLLARSDARRQEVALRVSLGCTRARLMRQFLAESALLAALGGVLSLGVAQATSRFAVALVPVDGGGPLRLDLGLDYRSLLATALVTALATLLFGLYPAWRAARLEASPELKGVAGGGRMGKLLVLGQVALGVLLLTAALGFTGRLRELAQRDAGFERTRLLLFDLKPGQSGYSGARLQQFYWNAERRMRDIPGVEAAGFATVRPMTGGGYWDRIKRHRDDGKGIDTAVNFVSPGFLNALGVRIVEGRGLDERDLRGTAKVAVVSVDLAKELADGASALGRRFTMDKAEIEVVGVAARARYSDMNRHVNVLYLPHFLDQESFTMLLRTRGAPGGALAEVRRAVAGLDRDLPLVDPRSMEEQIASTLRRERLFAWLCGAFGALALLLCVVGLYGVMSYATARRGREIGIRMALGATRGVVVRQVLREGLLLAAGGVAAGAPLAFYGGRFAEKLLELAPLPASVLGWSAGALGLAAFCAVLVPALRASSADPLHALRQG